MQRQSTYTDAQGKLQKFGLANRSARLERNLLQDALADLFGIDSSHTGKIELGKRNVSLLNVGRVADALEVSIASLISAAGL